MYPAEYRRNNILMLTLSHSFPQCNKAPGHLRATTILNNSSKNPRPLPILLDLKVFVAEQQHIQFHLLTTFVPQSCFIYG